MDSSDKPAITHPAVFQLAKFFPYRLNRLSATISEGLQQVYAQRFELSRDEWRILSGVNEHGRAKTTDLIASTGLDKMQASRAVARLEEASYISREADPEDRRNRILAITPAGRRLHAQIAPIVLAREAFLLEVLSDDERRVLDKALDALQQRAEQLRRQG